MIYLVFIGVLGLCIGSFLSVVIHRLPIIMQWQWQQDAQDFIAQSALSSTTKDDVKQHFATPLPVSMSHPRSQCPTCHTPIAWFDNLPVLSFVLLRGRCRACYAPIAWRYPALELITAILSVLVVLRLDLGLQGALGLVFVWLLIALSGIDWRMQILPDRLVLPLGMIGLTANGFGIFTTPSDAIFGAVAGFGVLWLVNVIYKLLRGHDGMGLGDAKLFAAIGAYLGAWQLPLVLLIAALMGVVVGVIHSIKHGRTPFAFGPYLAIGAVVALLFGKSMMTWYVSLF